MATFDKWDARNQRAADTLRERHDARNDRWAPRLRVVEPVVGVAAPVATYLLFGGSALAGFLLLSSPFYIWSVASWRHRRSATTAN